MDPIPTPASHLWDMATNAPRPKTSQAQLTTQFTTVVGMSLTLFLLGGVGMVTWMGHWATGALRQQVHVQVYLQRELSSNQLDAARLAITADPAVAQAVYLDPTEAATQLEEELGESFVSFLGYVPLPPVVDVMMQPEHAEPLLLEDVARRMESIPGVADVVWHNDLLAAIQRALDRWTPMLLGAAVLGLFVALALLNNTIRLTVFARRFLIRNMQLVGARPRLIRRPFIVQGLLLGMTSGMLAFAGTAGALTWLKEELGHVPMGWLLGLAGAFVLVGGALGAGFSGVAVNRYLKADLAKLH